MWWCEMQCNRIYASGGVILILFYSFNHFSLSGPRVGMLFSLWLSQGRVALFSYGVVNFDRLLLNPLTRWRCTVNCTSQWMCLPFQDRWSQGNWSGRGGEHHSWLHSWWRSNFNTSWLICSYLGCGLGWKVLFILVFCVLSCPQPLIGTVKSRTTLGREWPILADYHSAPLSRALQGGLVNHTCAFSTISYIIV